MKDITQENKDLLLKDLCARLPYGVKVKITNRESKNRVVHLESGWWNECKPYLFPLSSMTEEQKKEYYDKYCLSDYYALEKFDWFNKNHFDYRSLIEKGLAIDATGKNIY